MGDGVGVVDYRGGGGGGVGGLRRWGALEKETMKYNEDKVKHDFLRFIDLEMMFNC